MERKLPREEAWDLMTEYTKTSALQKHALTVEAVTRHRRGGLTKSISVR